MITEAEALTKWCPHFRHPTYGMDDRPSGGNSMHIGETAPVCIGSGCMMWRWAGWVNLTEDGSQEQSDTHHGPHVMPHGPTQAKHGCVRVGLCGLAGRS